MDFTGKHVDAHGQPLFTNRLQNAASPYLLQHAHNPVDWYPWGDEAFHVARRTRRPVLLSIGYSTCHWCHVMAEECFVNLAIATFMNDNYVAIKVDREELPVVDNFYMLAVQTISGQGGWPLTVWLDHQRRPFFGGTYFPPVDGPLPGFLTVLRELKKFYDRTPTDLHKRATDINARLVAFFAAHKTDTHLPATTLAADALQSYAHRYDQQHGGLRGAPKFPSSLPLDFLLRRSQPAARDMLTTTLDRMAAGGIYDHIEGGFHRYSTDAHWHVPHFEKMLYDNALLANTYLDAFLLTGQPRYQEVCRAVLRYLQEDMRAPQGGFYAATDADSVDEQGVAHEGYYFTFTAAEIKTLLPPHLQTVATQFFNITAGGNFVGRNVLYRQLHTDSHVAAEQLVEIRQRLTAARRRRALPLRDEKIITAWNALAISAFARAGFHLAEPQFMQVAEQAVAFLQKHLYVEDRLHRLYCDGQIKQRAFLDDYAFLGAALLDLYATSGKHDYLQFALHLDQQLHDHYEDKANGGFFISANDQQHGLPVREKPAYDGAEPCGNSIALMNLLRLAKITTDVAFTHRAEHLMRHFAPLLAQNPTALPRLLNAVDFYYAEITEIIIVVADDKRAAEVFLAELRGRFLPHSILLVVTEKETPLLKITAGKKTLQGQATAYVCANNTCHLPFTAPENLLEQLR